MSNNLLALKLLLENFGVNTDISNVDLRKEKQKAVYLAKIEGADLGYSYGWYVRGPYSPSLTADYYELSRQEVGTGQLRADLQAAVERARNKYYLTSPAEFPIHNWLELLASLHYLRKTSKYDAEKARQTIRDKKPHLTEHIAAAEGILGF